MVNLTIVAGMDHLLTGTSHQGLTRHLSDGDGWHERQPPQRRTQWLVRPLASEPPNQQPPALRINESEVRRP
jgi:hypothetical protein